MLKDLVFNHFHDFLQRDLSGRYDSIELSLLLSAHHNKPSTGAGQ